MLAPGLSVGQGVPTQDQEHAPETPGPPLQATLITVMANRSVKMLTNGVVVGNVEVGFLTDTGQRRTGNEDAYFVFDASEDDLESNGLLVAVADGMGGHAAGETASKIAAQTLSSYYENCSGKDVQERLGDCIRKANAEIYEEAQSTPTLKGMGTTLTVALVTNMTVNIGQVGDSRAYLIRNEAIRRLTDDHSLVAEQIRQGILTEEEAATHPARNIITRALGTREIVEVDYTSLALRPDDRILLCSDGLHGVVKDGQILDTILTSPSAPEACQELIDLANQGGGPDNITAVLVHLQPVRPFWRRLFTWP